MTSESPAFGRTTIGQRFARPGDWARLATVFNKLGVVFDVVGVGEVFGGDDEGYGSGGEFREAHPDAAFHQEASVRTVEQDRFLLAAVIDRHQKTSRDGDYEFFCLEVGVAATALPARHIVDMKDTPDREREMVLPFDDGKISHPRTGMTGKVDQAAIIYCVG